MQLTKQQISAIAKKIYDKRKSELLAQETASLEVSKKTMLPLAKKYLKLYESLPSDFVDIMRSEYGTISINKILNRLVKSKAPKSDKLSLSDIENGVIIASINCENLEAIEKKLKIKLN